MSAPTARHTSPTALGESAAGHAGQLAHLLARAERLLAERLRVTLDRAGLTLDAWRVLTMLADGQGHPMTAIARHAMLPPGTLTRLIDQLAETNLVYRRIDPLDRRRVRVFLSHRGRNVSLQVAAAIGDAEADIGLSEGQRNQLGSLLNALIETLEPDA